MKRKLLAIALSLALLSSLFVFASPISAGNEGNANENAGFFSVYTTPTADGAAYNVVRKWVGEDLAPDYPYGATVLSTILHYEHDRNFFIEITDVGSGTGLFHYESVRNYTANTRHGKGTFTATIFSDYPDNTIEIGTLTWRRISCRDWDKGTHKVKTVLIDATGVFEGLHWSDVNFVDESPYEWWVHYAP